MSNVLEILHIASYPMLAFSAFVGGYALYLNIRSRGLERTRFTREVGQEPEIYGFADQREFQRYKDWLLGPGKHVGREEDPNSVLGRYPPGDLRTVR